MIRETKNNELVINLDGSDGNAFALMGSAKRLAREIGYASDEVDVMLGKMTRGNYINLLKVFEEYFGSYVVLETTNSEYLEALA